MEPTEKELEDRLRDLGTRLTSPPSDVEELLLLLDQTEIYLSRVEQSPSTSMSDALRPITNSLITKEFLNHPETDVKVFVAACINEIIRVTAPDAPYNDALMKEIFAMIVDGFEKLDDMSGCLYSKRVSILEIMAKVRSCVVMLDLECDDLILHMFKHFLKSIRPDHPINVFSSMETIMTLILEESEDISQELLICLLSNVQKSKKGVMPVARRLAEKVISNCYLKLKPYFLVAVQSMGTYLSDYSDIVASICQDSSVALEQNEADDNKICERTVSDELPQESEKLDKPVSCLEEVGAFADKTTINMLSNGVMPLGNENALVEPISPELKPENSSSGEQCRNVVPGGENNSLGSITDKTCNELNFQYMEVKSSSVQLTDASDSSRVDGDKEASAPTSGRAGQKSQTKTLKSDGASDMAPETEELLEPEREAELQPLESLVGDNTCINSASPGHNPPGSGLSIRRRATNSQFSEKKSTSYRPVLSAGKKKMSGITTVEKEGPPAIFSEHKDHCLVSISDVKPSQDSANKSLADSVTAEVAAVGINDENPLRKEPKDAASVVADANTSENQWKSNTDRPNDKDVTEKDVSAEPCLKELMVSSKASIEENNDQNHLVKSAGGSLIKKRRRKDSREYNMYLEVVGREIEVWWPDDKKFYKGVIDAFDPVTQKHRVVYDDGDVEILFLRNERWNYIDSKNFNTGQENDIASPESSLHVPKKKRRARSGKRRKFSRKSNDIPIQQSGDENSTVKPRGSPTQITSELGTSLNEQTPENLVKEETNNSDKPPEETSIIKDNNTSRKFKRKNIFTPECGNKSVIRCGGEPRGETLKISGILNEETLKTPSNDDTEIKIESSEIIGLIIDSDEKLKEKDTLMVSEDPQTGRRKKKGTVTTTDINVSAIKNLEGFSQKVVAKTNKRRRK